MFVRILHLKVNSSSIVLLRQFYDNDVIPELQQMTGCQFAALIQSNSHPHEFISTSFWDTQAHAQTFEKSSIYKKLIEKLKPLLSESTEWKLQLSEDAELQYTAVPDEPVLKEYTVSFEPGALQVSPEENPQMYVRIVSITLQEDKLEEFRKIYTQDIIPALQATPGYQYAYLSESMQNKNEVISITIWDNKQDADNYESSGRFAEQVNKVKHTFTQIYQWKMALEKDFSGLVKTSEDLKVSHYSMVTGKTFH